MSEPVSLLGFVLEYVTDIAAVAGHADFPLLTCPLKDTIRIFRAWQQKCRKTRKGSRFPG
jgi:hypothetical protein